MEKKNEKGKVQLKGQLKLYIQWPAIMSLLLIAMDLWVYKLDHRAGILMAVFVVVYIIMVGGLYFYSKNIIMKDLVEFAAQYGIVQNTLLRELSIPYAILLDDGKAIWMNDELCCSGSLWFPDLDHYVRDHVIQSKCSVYLSLGGKEEKTKNKVMAAVGDRTRAQERLLQEDSMVESVVLEWNAGGHFADAGKRLAKGVKWMFGVKSGL